MIQAPVLALPDWSQEFIVETDASLKGLGAVLMQGSHPIAYVSKALSARQCALSVYEKELLAILLAVKHWHQYLILKHFTIRTVKKSLKHLLEQKITTPLQHTWLSKLMRYDYHIFYKKDAENNAADALSRVHSSSLFNMVVSSYDPILLERIKLHWSQDAAAQSLIQQLSQGVTIKHMAWNAVGGHYGIQPTLQRFRNLFYWKRADKDIKKWVKNCDVCLKAKYEAVATPGLLNPLPVPQSVFTDVSMDFISGLPKSGGKDTILVVVDRLTKFAHFIPLKHPFSAVHIAQGIDQALSTAYSLSPTVRWADRSLKQVFRDLFEVHGYG
ncbi:hypothetical protein L1987_61920 [Smallanthus sonchifolius]|uniref:Uncharacterized protein n=1 Tax=Smallanthus sonchifolius TaxID=185202 RepID=A0ACB9C8Y1_9ASTR|nr:hypothetical protein L1987_61920 [Smallanthus sonchifolius]